VQAVSDAGHESLAILPRVNVRRN